MNERENRDDIVKRVIDHTQKNERREMSSKEKEAVVEFVKSKVLPDAYRKQGKK